ncbi:MAG: carbohydrate ABC transporter permease, partial [Microbacteriaceae bacterium]
MSATAGVDASVRSKPGKSNRPRPAPSSRSIAARSFLYALLVAIAVVYIFPFLIQLATSFKTDANAAADPISLIPATWTTAAYQ